MALQSPFPRWITLLFLLLSHVPALNGQKLDLPGGQKARFAHYEPVVRSGAAGILRTIITSRSVMFHLRTDWSSPWALIGSAPIDLTNWNGELEDAHADVFMLATPEGVVRQYLLDDVNGRIQVIAEGLVSLSSGDYVIGLHGMGQYLVTRKYVYRSTSGPTSFEIDTAGIAEIFPGSPAPGPRYNRSWTALAPNGDIYQLYRDAILRRRADDARWSKVDSLGPYGESIFVDRRQRVYVGGWGRVWCMSDPSLSFVVHGTYDGGAFREWADDEQGNIYAKASNGRLFRSSGGTGPWQLIDSSIVALQQSATIANAIDITAGPYLVFTSAIGPFVSSDRGETWLHDADGTYGSTATGLVEEEDGTIIVGTSMGAYVRPPRSTSWTQTYPQNGFSTVRTLQRDADGTLWIQASGNAMSQGTSILRSTDRGSTWVLDSSPQCETGASTLFLDRQSVQYLALSSFASVGGLMWRREKGGSWVLDTVGLPSTLIGPPLFGEDGTGRVFVTFRTQQLSGLWCRNGEDASWSMDSVGLGMDQVVAMARWGSRGLVAGVTNRGLWERGEAGWRPIPIPNGMGENVTAVAISVDSLDAIIAAFEASLGLSRRILGTFRTTDRGASWVPLSVGSSTARTIVSTANATFVLAEDGAYRITTARSTTSIATATTSLPSTVALEAYPNPFNPEVRIRYALSEAGEIACFIVDVLGRRVATIAEGWRSAGVHEIIWRPSIAGGIYFVNLEDASTTSPGRWRAVRKIVLLR